MCAGIYAFLAKWAASDHMQQWCMHESKTKTKTCFKLKAQDANLYLMNGIWDLSLCFQKLVSTSMLPW